nr:gamma carbonic anhydrase family protein [uncultured Veillonella sp.]
MSIMMRFNGKYPKLDKKSHVMPSAQLIGDVELKEYASVWFNVTVRGDINKIVIGRYTNVQDNAVLHVDSDKACILGDFVTVGHTAIVHASTIEDNVLIGMGSVVLSGCHIGTGSIIAAGAVVLENTTIPPHSLVVGCPAKVIRTDETQIKRIHNQALKYKQLWTEKYGFLPDADGETYDGSTIV